MTLTLEYNKVCEINEKYKSTYIKKAEIYSQQDKYEEAIEQCNIAIKIDEEYFNAYDEKAKVYIKQGKYKKAISVYTEIIKIDKDYKYAEYTYTSRSEIYKKLGMEQEAELDDMKINQIRMSRIE